MTMSGLTTAVQGIQLNRSRFAATGDRITRAAITDAPTEDLTRDLVGLRAARFGLEANLAVFRAADEMVGTLLDVLA